MQIAVIVPLRGAAAPAARSLTGRAQGKGAECTGFGLKMVSGNFEFAPDRDRVRGFLSRYGGDVAADWESITELAGDAAWSNEGLFAFLQGLRRLRQTGADRVNVPVVGWEIG